MANGHEVRRRWKEERPESPLPLPSFWSHWEFCAVIFGYYFWSLPPKKEAASGSENPFISIMKRRRGRGQIDVLWICGGGNPNRKMMAFQKGEEEGEDAVAWMLLILVQ
jgi:hypothetical protein